MNRFRSTVTGGALALAASLLLARIHPFGNAGLYAAKAPQAPLLQSASVPPEVRAILISKCADCHSMQGRAPLYGRLAPASWLMERDILDGRKHLDLSEWGSYSTEQREVLKAKIVDETLAGKMPLPQYLAVHWSAHIQESDVGALKAWARQEEAGSTAASEASTAAGDPVRGKDVFDRRCSGCHSMTQDREGPRLQGVYGRMSGTRDGFGYSPALKKARIVWDDASLERWLTDPDALVPGNNMEFHVSKHNERSDLISYLKASSPN